MKKIEAGTDVRAVVENHRTLAGKLSTGTVLTTDEVKELIDHYRTPGLFWPRKVGGQVEEFILVDKVYYTLRWIPGLDGAADEFPEQVAKDKSPGSDQQDERPVRQFKSLAEARKFFGLPELQPMSRSDYEGVEL